MKYKDFFIIFIFFLAIFTILNFSKNSYIKIAGQNIKIELADTVEKQQKGLSGRKNLEENRGMLFVFPKSDYYAFWMKDMLFPIDIVWLSSDFKVVYIVKNALPSSYPESFIPDIEAKYVLEVISGFSENNNLQIGDTVEFLSKKSLNW